MIDVFTGQYEFLSNFFVDASGYCAEVEYQALKAVTDEDREYVRQSYRFSKARIPREAKKRGKKIKLRADWEKIKLEVMEAVVRTKFLSEVMKQLLLSTSHHKLVEGNWWHDTFWGVCSGGMRVNRCPGHPPEGENHLGEILMKVREELKK